MEHIFKHESSERSNQRRVGLQVLSFLCDSGFDCHHSVRAHVHRKYIQFLLSAHQSIRAYRPHMEHPGVSWSGVTSSPRTRCCGHRDHRSHWHPRFPMHLCQLLVLATASACPSTYSSCSFGSWSCLQSAFLQPFSHQSTSSQTIRVDAPSLIPFESFNPMLKIHNIQSATPATATSPTPTTSNSIQRQVRPPSNIELTQINSIDAPLLSRTDSSYAVRVQDCPGWNSTNLSTGFAAYEEMETQLKCSGWCENTSSLFYRFTDVNKGIGTALS